VSTDSSQVEQLYTDVEWAMSQGLSPRDLIPMLQRLALAADPASEYSLYARRNLAELIVQRSPFRAARLARSVLCSREDDRAYAVLGLAHLLMGNYRSAEKAYRSALAILPHCPWYAHNLGHLLDVGLNRPQDALSFLKLARRGLPQEVEIKASLAHALLRSGARAEAERELLSYLEDPSEAQAQIERWTAESPVA
jgi:predicted Zn-dependent protease